MLGPVKFLRTLQDLKEFFNITAKQEASDVLCLDVETDSTFEKTAKLFGIGLCFGIKQAYYIPIRDNQAVLLWTKEDLTRLAEALRKLCARKKLIGHNIIYDVLVVKNNLSIDLTDTIYADTILMKHCVDEEPPFALKDTAVKYLGPWADKAQQELYASIQANGGKTNKSNLEMWKANTDVLGRYCGWDVMLTFKLFELFSASIKEQNLEKLFYEEEIMPLYKECVIPMKDKGFPVDVEYFAELKRKLIEDLDKLEDEIQKDLEQHTQDFILKTLTEEFPAKLGGALAKEVANILGIPRLKNELKKYQPKTLEEGLYRDWILYSNDAFIEEHSELLYKAAMTLWTKRNPDQRYVFNLSSNNNLAWLFFETLGIKPIKHTAKGSPSVDADTLDGLAGEHPVCDKIIEYRRLQKLMGTYIEGLLERQYQGVIYGSFLMFGTTSGRFSSRNPNLQNLPRVKDEESQLSELVLKYTNAIKRGFIAPKGYKIVNADYSQLEPCAFAAACGDEKLQAIFKNKWDLYSSIAIESFGAKEYSADKKAPNYLKNSRPELRQKAKVVALAVVYGAEAGRIAQVLKCEKAEAAIIIRDYLNAYPGLKGYMKECDDEASSKGFIRNKFGRIRHLPIAKKMFDEYGYDLLNPKWAYAKGLKDERYIFKNYLNNAKNFPIQSTAAHVVNRAMIAIVRKFKECSIDGYIAAQVHDEITCLVREDQAELAKTLVKDCMENTTKLAVPLQAEPLIAQNWAEAK